MNDDPEVYAIPGENSIIDTINPETGLTRVYGSAEAEVLERNPGAVRMTWADWRAGAIARQQAIAIAWEPSSKAKFDEMLNVLPPIGWTGRAFLVGEPTDHCFATGAPRFQAYRVRGSHWFERYEAASRPMTVAEFRAAVRS